MPMLRRIICHGFDVLRALNVGLSIGGTNIPIIHTVCSETDHTVCESCGGVGEPGPTHANKASQDIN